ncbi:hypothetical protein [Arthrobacter sp. IK3]|uniref:hypothetical protein n=1 Tax=Arthrobacter sp. IK3 TaxID=3448169 RepID=UPI003EDEDA00
MFTAPARKLANALANALIFADTKAADHRQHLAAVRVRVRTNTFDAMATDAYIIGHGRAGGSSPGDTWTALLPVSELKQAATALKRSKGEASVDFDGTAVTFIVGDSKYLVTGIDGAERFDAIESLFPALMNYEASPGYLVIDPDITARLGKLKDYDSANTVVDAHRPHALILGLNPDPSSPAVGAFGPDFRLLIAARRAKYTPNELAYAGWNSWEP